MEEDEEFYPSYIQASIIFINKSLEADEAATYMYQEKCLSQNRLEKIWNAETKLKKCQLLHPCLSTLDQCKTFMDALVDTKQEFIREEILKNGERLQLCFWMGLNHMFDYVKFFSNSNSQSYTFNAFWEYFLTCKPPFNKKCLQEADWSWINGWRTSLNSNNQKCCKTK